MSIGRPLSIVQSLPTKTAVSVHLYTGIGVQHRRWASVRHDLNKLIVRTLSTCARLEFAIQCKHRASKYKSDRGDARVERNATLLREYVTRLRRLSAELARQSASSRSVDDSYETDESSASYDSEYTTEDDAERTDDTERTEDTADGTGEESSEDNTYIVAGFLSATGVVDAFPGVASYFGCDVSTATEVDYTHDYFTQISVFNQLIILCTQLRHDAAALPDHHCVAHQVALLYQCMKQLGGEHLNAVRPTIQAKFASLKDVKLRRPPLSPTLATAEQDVLECSFEQTVGGGILAQAQARQCPTLDYATAEWLRDISERVLDEARRYDRDTLRRIQPVARFIRTQQQ